MAASAYVYLHGFGGDVLSERGLVLKKRLGESGIDLQIMDVKGGVGHEKTTVTIGLEALDKIQQQEGKKLRLIGSSMGGMISLLYAARQPEKVDRIVLINPAVNLEETWSTIANKEDPSVFEKWKADGIMQFTVDRETTVANIPFSYVEDSLQYPRYPIVNCPSLLFIGKQDRTVPPKNGYVLQLEQTDPKQMTMIELDDDHSFIKPETIERLVKEIVEFFD